MARFAACVLAAALGMPVGAAAQRIEVPGAPWGATRADVARAFEGLGYRILPDTVAMAIFSATFSRGDGIEHLAVYGPNGLAMLSQIHRLPPPEARLRFGALRDSLVRVLGPPDSAHRTIWVRADGRIELFVRPDSAGLASAAILNRARPNHLTELAAAYQATAQAVQARHDAWHAARIDSSRWTRLALADSLGMSFERASVERRQGGAWRVRVRWDWLAPRRQGRQTYDALVHATEIDCANGTFRMGRMQWFLGERRVVDIDSWDPVTRPVAGSADEVMVRELCRYAQALPQAEPPPG